MIGEARLVIRYAIDPPGKRRGELVAEGKKLSPAALHKLQQYGKRMGRQSSAGQTPSLSLSLSKMHMHRKEERRERTERRRKTNIIAI